MIRIVTSVFVAVFGLAMSGATAQSRPSETRPTVKALTLQMAPDSRSVPDASMRRAIEATGRPWRIALAPHGIEMVLVPPSQAVLPLSNGTDPQWNAIGLRCRDIDMRLTYAYYISRHELPNRVLHVVVPGWADRQRQCFEYRADCLRLSKIGALGQAPDDSACGLERKAAHSACRSLGGRLPSEAEWLMAYWLGRSTDDESGRRTNLEKVHGNNLDESTVAFFGGYYPGGRKEEERTPWKTTAWAVEELVGPSIGGQFPANRLGIYDMDGNLEEWTYPALPSDWYREGTTAEPSHPFSVVLDSTRLPGINSLNQAAELFSDVAYGEDALKKRCGSSWMHPADPAEWMRLAYGVPFSFFHVPEFIKVGVRLVVDPRNVELPPR